jgi:hypothetical protein
MLVLILGYSIAFAVSMPTSKTFAPISRDYHNATVYEIASDTVVTPLLTTTMAMVGAFDVDEYNHDALVMFLSFLFFIIIVNFNVQIAIVSERFNEVMETADVEVRRLRAELMINDEARMSDAERSNKAWFPDYLEVLQVEGCDPQTGCSQSENAAAGEAQAAANAKIDAISDKQDALSEKQDALAAEVAELKTMMALLVEQTKPTS